MFETLEGRTLFDGSSVIALSTNRLLYNEPQGGAASPSQFVTLSNTGSTSVNISSGGLTFTGPNASLFQLDASTTTPITIAPGDTAQVGVNFNPSVIGVFGAALHIVSDDPAVSAVDVTLRGLGTYGLFGSNEPSLQWILDTYQIPVKVGDSTPAESTLDFPPKIPNDEVPLQLMVKAGAGNVKVQPIAVFSNAADPAQRVGFYSLNSSNAPVRTEEYVSPAADVQTINPHVIGTSQFDPGNKSFGLYTAWPYFNKRLVYTQDSFNTWKTNTSQRHLVRFYPMKNPDGSAVPNSYVMAVEEAENHDYQDGVYIVSNVRPVPVSLYQAENASFVGPIISKANAGYTGTGYVDFTNNSNDYLQFTVDATAGAHTLTFRYANGGTTDRPLSLSINGTVVQPKLSFGPTGSWATWKTVSIAVNLNDGLNTVRLTAIGFSGGNVDSLTVT